MDEETVETVDTSGDSVLDPSPDPAPAADPVQVVSVDELINRLTSAGEDGEAAEDETEEPTPDEPSAADQFFASALEDTTGQDTVQLLREIKTEIQQLAPHDLMTTNFSDYTVTEGLLLLALIGGVASICIKMLRRGFSWLTW